MVGELIWGDHIVPSLQARFAQEQATFRFASEAPERLPPGRMIPTVRLETIECNAGCGDKHVLCGSAKRKTAGVTDDEEGLSGEFWGCARESTSKAFDLGLETLSEKRHADRTLAPIARLPGLCLHNHGTYPPAGRRRGASNAPCDVRTRSTIRRSCPHTACSA